MDINGYQVATDRRDAGSIRYGVREALETLAYEVDIVTVTETGTD